MYKEEKLHINEKRNRRIQRKKRSAKRRMWNIATTVAFSALLFGVVEGGTSYAVEQYLIGQNNEAVTANETSSTTDTNVLSLSATTNSSTDQLSVTEIAASGLSSVVSVTNISVQEVENYFGGHGGNRSRQFSPSQTEETVSCGSGIILYEEDSQLYMLTNYHVVEGASSLSVTFVDDETYEAVLCGYDADIDLAVLKVDTSALSESTYSQSHVVEIGDSDALEVGEQVVAIGNALGYGQSVTTGIVSAVNRSISEDTQSSSLGYIQTDAAINPGNSGGALLDMEGKLVGINTAKIASTDVEGIGYAIPITDVSDIITNLMSQETKTKVSEADRGYLGITGLDVEEADSARYGMPTGVYISEVSRGSGAAKAGITKGSIIVEFNGITINGMNALQEQLQYYEKGEKVTLTLQVPGEGGEYKEQSVEVTLGSRAR